MKLFLKINDKHRLMLIVVWLGQHDLNFPHYISFALEKIMWLLLYTFYDCGIKNSSKKYWKKSGTQVGGLELTPLMQFYFMVSLVRYFFVRICWSIFSFIIKWWSSILVYILRGIKKCFAATEVISESKIPLFCSRHWVKA